MSHALTRRTLLGTAATGAIGLSLGRWIAAAPAGAVGPVPTAETYVALRDTLTPLDTRGAAAATEQFQGWWLRQDEGMRGHVRRVFEALDRGARGSFATADRGERAALLDRWTRPSADPLRDASARDRLSLGRGAVAIVHAPQDVPDGRVPLG